MARTGTIASGHTRLFHCYYFTVLASDYFDLLLFSATNWLSHGKRWTTVKWEATLTKC